MAAPTNTPLTAYEGFDDFALGSAAPSFAGFANGTSSNWVVVAAADAAVSQAYSYGETTFNNGHTLAYTKAGAETTASGMCVQISQRVNLNSSGQGAQVGVGLRGDSTASTTGYLFLFDFHANAIQYYYHTSTSGGYQSVAANGSFAPTFNDGDTAVIKVNALGTTLSTKIWKLGTAEPTTWTSQLTNQTQVAAGPLKGYPWFYCATNNGGNGTSLSAFDDLYVGPAQTATQVFPSQLIRGNSPGMYFSGCSGGPSNWALNGGNNGQMITVNPGAELDVSVSGTTQIAMKVIVSNFVAAGYPSTSYPKIKYILNGGQPTVYQLQSTDQVLNLATGLSGTTTLQLWLEGLDNYGGNSAGTPLTTKWSGINSLIITAILVDAAATVAAAAGPGISTGTWVAMGDSETEGEWQLANSSGNLPSAVSAEQGSNTYAAFLAQAKNCQVVNCAFGGTDFLNTFDSDVPPIIGSAATPTVGGTFNFIYSGVSRTFTTPPKFWSLMLGANNQLGSLSVSNAEALVVAALTAIRAFYGSASQGFVFVPINGIGNQNNGATLRTMITAAYKTFIANNPGDNLVLVDINDSRFVGTYGTPTTYLSDGLHPTPLGHSVVAAEAAALIAASSGGEIATSSGVFATGGNAPQTLNPAGVFAN